MAQTVNVPRESTVARMADALEEANALREREFGESVLAALDGTEESYRAQMRRWMVAHGARTASPEELTEICAGWYALTRHDFLGWVDFYQPDVSAVSTGEAGGDLAGMSCEPSTDTAAGADDFAGHAMWAPTDVNWELDALGNLVVTDVEGVTDGFERRNPDRYVGVMQMAPWVCRVEYPETYREVFSAYPSVPYPVEPVAEAVAPDGTFRQFVVHGKYVAHKRADGGMTCCAGVAPTAWQSHNSSHTMSKANGARYSGMCACDVEWLRLMAVAKYRSLTMDGIVQGCCSNSAQAAAAVAETGVRRVLVAKTTGFEPGMNVLVGTYSTSTDRNSASMYSVSGQAGLKVTAVEPATVDGVEYTAVYVDAAEPFDTAANGSATEGTTYVSTFHWDAGATDCVLGNDGSPTSCTSGRYPAKLQGVEYMVGAYEVVADAELSMYADADGAYWYEPYVVSDATKQATSITADYAASGLRLRQPDTAGWQYIKKHGRAHGISWPVDTGGSSSTYVRDAIYANAATVSTHEWLCFGPLYSGSAYAGLGCVNGLYALSGATWLLAARLSPNGNRGEWAA